MVVQNRKPKSSPKKRLLLVGLAAVILVGIAVFGVLYHQHKLAADKANAVMSPRPITTKGAGTEPSSSNSGNPAQKGSSSQTGSTSTPTPSNQTLQKPAGTFVSNHKPGQNNSPTQESSVCMTTPGATCYISFTQGSVTKTLSTQTADGTGAAYWQSWTPASIGLTSGSWTVKAVATLGQQTANTQDPTPLEIK